MMMRFFSSKTSISLVNKMLMAEQEVAKKLSVESLRALTMTEQPISGDVNAVSIERFQSAFH